MDILQKNTQKVNTVLKHGLNKQHYAFTGVHEICGGV